MGCAHSLFSPRRIAALAALLLSGCVVSPGVEIGGDSIPRGKALDAGDNIVVLLSLKLTQADSPDQDDGVRPLHKPEPLREAFVSGFQSVAPQAKVFFSDEVVRLACVDAGARSRGKYRTVVIDPAMSDPGCQAVLRERAVRYLVLVTGWAQTETSEQGGRVGKGRTTIDLPARQYHTFRIDTRTYSIESARPVCEDSASETATTESHRGLLLLGYLPVPMFEATVVDEGAFIERAARRAGVRTASCFLPVPPPR